MAGESPRLGFVYGLRQHFPQPADLIGVSVRVRGVSLQPIFGRVPPALGVRAFAQPVFLGHSFEQLRGGRPRGAERFERGRDVALVVPEPRRVQILVITLDDRIVLCQQPPQPDRAGHLAVGQVLDDLGGAPFARNQLRGQFVFRKSFERAGDFVIAGGVFGDQIFSISLCHRFFPIEVCSISDGSPSSYVTQRSRGRTRSGISWRIVSESLYFSRTPSASARLRHLPRTMRCPGASWSIKI